MKFKKYAFNSVKSTNDISIKKIKSNITQGIIISNKQTNGRGRFGKKWKSLNGNLFMSVFFKISKNIKLEDITKKNCLIVKKTLSKFISRKIKIKAPNDLMINNQKICGILQEICYSQNNKFLIVGIGVNVVSCPKISNYPTTYLNKYTKKRVDKLVIFRSIQQMYEKFLKKN